MSFWCISSILRSQCCKTIVISYPSFSLAGQGWGAGQLCSPGLLTEVPALVDAPVHSEGTAATLRPSHGDDREARAHGQLHKHLHFSHLGFTMGSEMSAESRRKKYVPWAVGRHWKLTWYPVASHILGSKWRIIQSATQTSATKVGI